MSYILEALRKSERERRLGQVPSLPSLYTDASPSRPRLTFWMLGVTLILTVNAAILGGFWLQGQERPAAVIPAQREPAVAAIKSVETPAATTAPNPLEQRLLELEDRLAKIGPPTATDAMEESKVVSPPVPIPPPASIATSAPAPIPPPASIANSAHVPREAKIRPGTGPQGRSGRETAVAVPAPESLPPDYGAFRHKAMEDTDETEKVLPKAIQALKINVLAYSSVPEERFAVVNMSKHFRGDSLPGGVRLVDILADGLVVELNGERFRVRH